MAQKLYEESNIQAIANAIRGKNGLSDTYKPNEMAAAIEGIQTGGAVEALDITANGTYTAPDGIDGYSPITVNVPQDGSPPEEAFVISGDCKYRFANSGWDWFIEYYNDRITTSNIRNSEYMFTYSLLKNIPFELNFSPTTDANLSYMFSNAMIESVPKINNCKVSYMGSMFSDCTRLRSIPEDFDKYFDWSYMDSKTSSWSSNMSSIFSRCYSLRKIPMGIFEHGNKYEYYSMGNLYGSFNGCYALDEILDLPLIYEKSNGNYFYANFQSCQRIKNITMKMPNGVPYTKEWNKQIIDLTSYVGFAGIKANILNYNSGITADKEVIDDATYQALKDDPDWFTTKVEYSRYNHDSAVATINSLPDTSAYLASAGGTNTIKFKGASGSKTDGGAINTLTEEEIAVATAKGWTVTLA